jgi:hypothetical protein
VQNRFRLGGLLLYLFGNCALADTYSPFADERVVAPGGRYYVVIERQGGTEQRDQWGPVNLTIAEQAPGARPVDSARALVDSRIGLYVTRKNTNISVRDGDTVHARIKLEHPPGITLISSTGLVVLLDYYGINSLALRNGNAVSILSLKGELLHGRKLSDILTWNEIWSYDNKCGSLWLLYGAWINETDHDLIIIGSDYNLGKSNRPIAVINLDSGKVRRGGPEDVRNAIIKADSAGLELALEIGLEMKLQGVKEHLPKIVSNEKMPLGARLRAAAFLATFGEKDGSSLFSRVALMASKNQLDDLADDYDEQLAHVVGYAIRHLPEVLGEQAAPVLRDASRKYGYGVGLVHAFSRLGEQAVSTLIAMLEDERDIESQYLAIEALAEIGPRAKPAVPALIKALDSNRKTSRDLRIDAVAAYALGCLGHEARTAIPALSRLTNNSDEEVRRRATEALEKINK